MMGVSLPPSFADNATLEQLNTHMRNRLGGRFIPPLNEVIVDPKDTLYKIHYDQNTVDRVITKIYDFLLQKETRRKTLT